MRFARKEEQVDPHIAGLLSMDTDLNIWTRRDLDRLVMWMSRDSAEWKPGEREEVDAWFDRMAALPGEAWGKGGIDVMTAYVLGPAAGRYLAICCRAVALGIRSGAKDAETRVLTRREIADISDQLEAQIADIARDAFHEEVTYLNARGFGTYDPERGRSLKSFLELVFFRMAHRMARSRFREKTRPLLAAKQTSTFPATAIAAQARKAEAKEEIEQLLPYVGRLPARLRQAVELCCVQELNPTEAAEIAGVPPNCMRVRKFRALHKLHGIAREHCKETKPQAEETAAPQAERSAAEKEESSDEHP